MKTARWSVIAVSMLGLIVLFQNISSPEAVVYGLIKNAPATNSVQIPIEFGGRQYTDDPQRATSLRDVGAGTPGFDKANRSYSRVGPDIVIQDQAGNYVLLDFAKQVKKVISEEIMPKGTIWDGRWDTGNFVDSRIVFDDQERCYTIVNPKYSNLKNAVLFYSLDRCRSWHGIALRGDNAAIESRDGFNDLSGPPAVVSFPSFNSLIKNKLWVHAFDFDAANKLYDLYSPGRELQEPSLLTMNHSGGGNSVLTKAGKVFVVFPSSRPLPDGGKRGTQTYICEIQRIKNAPQENCKYLGIAGDITRFSGDIPPDAHHIPAITVDSSGQLTVVFGSHLGLFKMTQSEQPLSIQSWTPVVPIGEPMQGTIGKWTLYGSYTYVGLNTDKNDNLHIFSRAEGTRATYQLVQMTKPKGQGFKVWVDPFSNQKIVHRVIVDPKRSFYAAYRQKVAMDNKGDLYLHFKYWPNQLFPDEAALFKLTPDSVAGCDNTRYCFYGESQVPYLYSTTLKITNSGQNFLFFAAGK